MEFSCHSVSGSWVLSVWIDFSWSNYWCIVCFNKPGNELLCLEVELELEKWYFGAEGTVIFSVVGTQQKCFLINTVPLGLI